MNVEADGKLFGSNFQFPLAIKIKKCHEFVAWTSLLINLYLDQIK